MRTSKTLLHKKDIRERHVGISHLYPPTHGFRDSLTIIKGRLFVGAWDDELARGEVRRVHGPLLDSHPPLVAASGVLFTHTVGRYRVRNPF